MMGQLDGSGNPAAEPHALDETVGRSARRRLASAAGWAGALAAGLVIALLVFSGSDKTAVLVAGSGGEQVLDTPDPLPARLDPVFDASTTVPPPTDEAPATASTPAAEESAAPPTSTSTAPPAGPTAEISTTWWTAPPSTTATTFTPAPPVGPEDLPAAVGKLITSLADLDLLVGKMSLTNGHYIYEEVEILDRFENPDGTSVPISDELRAVIESSAYPVAVTFVSEAPGDYNSAFIEFAEPVAEGNTFWFLGRIECGPCKYVIESAIIGVAKEVDGCWHLDQGWHQLIYGSNPMC